MATHPTPLLLKVGKSKNGAKQKKDRGKLHLNDHAADTKNLSSTT